MNPPNSAASAYAWTALPGVGTGFVRSDWKENFDRAGLRQLEDFFGVTGEALSKPGLGHRYRARLRLEASGEACVVFLKRFGSDPWRERWKRWMEDGLWHSPAEREVRVAETLHHAGIAAPEPLVWGRQGRGAKEISFVVLSSVPGEPMDSVVQRGFKGERVLSCNQLKELVRRAADLARRFHEAGWRHRDLYLCHFFVEARDGEGDFRCFLIDLQRVFKPRWRPRRWLVKDLAQLNFSAAESGIPERLRLHFLHLYLGREQLNREDRRLLRAIAKKTESMRRRNR